MAEQEKNMKRTEIAEYGEFGLIEHLTKNFHIRNKSTIKGVGDDAAVISAGEKEVKVIGTDMMVEGIHFDLSYHPLQHLGYKSVIVNLSDIYAMNAIPEQITVSLAISNRFSVEALDLFYEGVMAACEKYDVDLVGGDTNASRKGFIVNVSAIGHGEKDQIVYRDGAKEGDLIAVSGDLGAAFLGLQILEREKQIYMENPEIQPDLEGEKYLVGRQLLPEARRDVIEYFDDLKFKPNAMIDVSDGLSSDLIHICRQSGVGCVIYEDHLPVSEEAKSRAMKFNIPTSTAVLNGGEDYELLFTFPPEWKDKIEKHPDFSIIGYTTKASAGYKLKTPSGQVHPLEAQGWKHL